MKKKFDNKKYQDAYRIEQYARPWVSKVTHRKALVISKKLGVHITKVYEKAINELKGKTK